MFWLMREACSLVWSVLVLLFQSRASLGAEILVLRHQLNIQRRHLPKRLTFSAMDRLIFVRNGGSGMPTCVGRRARAPRSADVVAGFFSEPSCSIRSHKEEREAVRDRCRRTVRGRCVVPTRSSEHLADDRRIWALVFFARMEGLRPEGIQQLLQPGFLVLKIGITELHEQAGKLQLE